MASDMKRVGLVFDADGTVKFKESLRDVNGAMADNRTSLKLLQAEYDNNTKATKKLQDQQTFLSAQYDNSVKKVEILTQEIEELSKEEGKNKDAIEKKKKQLNTANLNVVTYGKSLEEVNKKLKLGTADLEEYAKKLENQGKKAKEIGGSLTKNLTAPIVAVGTAATASWVEIDKAYDNITKATGATGDDLLGLHEVFDEVFGSMPVSVDNASNAIGELNTRFGFVDDVLVEASSTFLKFAEINNTDVQSAVALVSRAMGDAGIEATEYDSILDALTAASQGSGLSIDALTESITKYGAPMRALGYETEQSIALFAQWEKAGVNTEIAFSGMKTAISSWSAEGKDASVEFQKTLDQIASAPNIAEATTMAIDTFGKKAGPDLADAIQGGRFSIEEFMNAVETSGGVVAETYENIISPADKAKVTFNNLKLAGAELGAVIQETTAPIFEYLTEILQNIISWFSSLDGGIQQTIVVLGILLAAIGPIIWILGSLATGISSMITLYTGFIAATAGASAAGATLGATLASLAAPIAIAVAAVVAIALAIKELWNTNDDFRDAVTKAWTGIQDTLQNAYDKVLKPVLDQLKNLWNSLWTESLKPLWDKFVTMIGDFIIQASDLWLKIKPIVDFLIDIFGVQFAGTFAVLSGAISGFVNYASGLFQIFMDTTGGIILSIMGIFGRLIDFITGTFTENWKKAWQGISDIFANIANGFKAIFKEPLNAIIAMFNGLITSFNTMLKGLSKIGFSLPDWIPIIGGKSFNFPTIPSIGKIPMLATGGNLLGGMAMVGEAGPELLRQEGNRTTVTPLSKSGGINQTDIIDYEKLAAILIQALKYLNIVLDREVVGKFVDDRLLEVF